MTAWFGRGASGAVARGRARTPSSKASLEPALHGREGRRLDLEISRAELAGGEEAGLRNFSGSFALRPTAVAASADAWPRSEARGQGRRNGRRTDKAAVFSVVFGKSGFFGQCLRFCFFIFYHKSFIACQKEHMNKRET